MRWGSISCNTRAPVPARHLGELTDARRGELACKSPSAGQIAYHDGRPSLRGVARASTEPFARLARAPAGARRAGPAPPSQRPACRAPSPTPIVCRHRPAGRRGHRGQAAPGAVVLVGRGDAVVFEKAYGQRAVVPARRGDDARHDLRPRVADQGRRHDDRGDAADRAGAHPAQRSRRAASCPVSSATAKATSRSGIC